MFPSTNNSGTSRTDETKKKNKTTKEETPTSDTVVLSSNAQDTPQAQSKFYCFYMHNVGQEPSAN
jgi:hypothetical protein